MKELKSYKEVTRKLTLINEELARARNKDILNTLSSIFEDEFKNGKYDFLLDRITIGELESTTKWLIENMISDYGENHKRYEDLKLLLNEFKED